MQSDSRDSLLGEPRCASVGPGCPGLVGSQVVGFHLAMQSGLRPRVGASRDHRAACQELGGGGGWRILFA